MTPVVDGAAAVMINPAALMQSPRWSVMTTYNQPHGVSGLDEGYAAASVRFDRIGAFGLAMHHVGLRDVTSENLVTVAYARDIMRTSEDASLSVGINVDFARVAVEDRFDVSESNVTGGASILLRPFPVIGLAYTTRNLSEPEFDLVPGAGKTTLRRVQTWGVSYWWHRRVTVVYERRNDTGHGEDHFGVEFDMGPYLDVRAGLARGQAAGGIGIEWNNVGLDAGFSSNEFMGASYVVSVRYAPPRPVNPYAQKP